MDEVIELLEHSSMTLDDMEFFCRRHGVQYTVDDERLTVTDGSRTVKFSSVLDDVTIHIFEQE